VYVDSSKFDNESIITTFELSHQENETLYRKIFSTTQSFFSEIVTETWRVRFFFTFTATNDYVQSVSKRQLFSVTQTRATWREEKVAQICVT